jgi:hypothetical protein
MSVPPFCRQNSIIGVNQCSVFLKSVTPRDFAAQALQPACHPLRKKVAKLKD